jgi:hypothetical protein
MNSISHQRKIRAAVVGYRDNGKSTFINAMLRKEYSLAGEEDSTKRALEFNLSISEHPTDPEEVKKDVQDFYDIMNESDTDNALDPIQLPLNLLDLPVEMHHDLGLSFVDFPGLDAHVQYEAELKDGAFDLVIVVVDASVAARQELLAEQANLLKFIATCVNVKRPACKSLIIGINKVDDLDDPDTAKRVAKLNQLISDIFGVECPNQALKKESDDLVKDTPQHEEGPIVVNMSAKNAFHYRWIAGLTKDQFIELNNNQIRAIVKDGLGSMEVQGESWDKLSHEERAEKAYEISRPGDNCVLNENLDATGFPGMMAAIQSCIAGYNRQGYLVCQQARREQVNIPVGIEGGYTEQFKANMDEQMQASDGIDGCANFKNYKEDFHEMHLKLVLGEFKKSPDMSNPLVTCFEELRYFHDNVGCLLYQSGSKTAVDWPQKAMTILLQSQLKAILDQASASKHKWNCESADAASHGKRQRDSWDDLTMKDWMANIDSILEKLSVLNNIADLSREKMRLEGLRQDLTYKYNVSNLEGAVSFNWASVADLLHCFLEKEKEKRFEDQINAAVGRRDIGSDKKVTKDIEEIARQGSENAENIKKLSGMKRSIDEFLTKVACSNSKRVITIDDDAQPIEGSTEKKPTGLDENHNDKLQTPTTN